MAIAALGLLAAACGGDDDGNAGGQRAGGDGAAAPGGGASNTSATDEGDATGVRLGIFPNVTHSPGLVGIDQDILEEALGAEVTVFFYNAGGEAAQALLAGQIDISYIGPNPAINAFAQSRGDAVRIVSGSTSGGAFLIARASLDSPDDLAGARLASPEPIGNTQDVAMKSWLHEQGFEIGTGDDEVDVVSMANADVLQAFQQGDLDGAWTVEPWATRLIEEGGGHVLIDERDIWPDGRYVTTHVLARTDFLEDHPDVVERFLDGHLAALEFVNENPEESQGIVVDQIVEATGARLDDRIVAAAWENLEFTWDPIASSLQESADDGVAVGLLDPVELDGIYDLTILNALLAERGEEEVAGL